MDFEVYSDGKLAQEFTLAGAYMFGADSVALRASVRIEFEKGILHCTKKTTETAGLSLLWPVKGFGKVLLSTTRLADSDRPYILNVEIARARLMQITVKREEWALFDETGTLLKSLHQAKSLFIDALKNISEPAKASKLADESLMKALIFSEKLAVKHCEVVLAGRCRNKSLSRHSLGCTIEPEYVEDEKYRKLLTDMFGYVTIPVSWAEIEPVPGQYDFSSIDRCLASLEGKRLAICAGPLLRFSKDHIPKWLIKEKPDFERVRELAYQFVVKMVDKYSKKIHAWKVISGINAINCFKFNFEQIFEITRTACLASKAADVKSRKIVEMVYPWGEYYATSKETIPPQVYADLAIQSGISFDGFGLELIFGKNTPGMHVRDLMHISSKLDSFGAFSKPLHITAVGVSSKVGTGKEDPMVAGIWHKLWDQQAQSEWVELFYRVALGKSFVSSVTYSSFADHKKMAVSNSGLIDKKFNPKKSLVGVAKLQKLILSSK